MKNKKHFNLKPYIPLIFIIGIFVFLCSFVINRAIWFDESYSAQTIKGTFSEIVETTAADVHPPLYYWLLKIWSVPFGRSLIALRSLSLFFAIVTLVFAFLTFRRWSKTQKIATFLTSAIALCPFFIYYATEIRMYSMVCAIVMASIYVLDLALEKKSKKYWIFYGLLLTAALYTHYFSAFAFFAEYIYVLVCRRKDIEKPFRKLFFVSIFAFVLYLPWLPSLISQVVAVEHGYWIDPITPSALMNFFSQSLLYFEYVEKNTPFFILTLITLAVVIITTFTTYGEMGKNTKSKFLLIVFVVFIPFLSLILLSIPPLSPVYITRYLTYSLTLFWVLVAILIVQSNSTVSFLSKILAALMLVCSILGFFNVCKDNNYQPVFKEITAQIELIDDDDKVTPIIFDEASSDAFNAVFYGTEKHPMYIIDPMEGWHAALPLSRYGKNYISDFEKFKEETPAFWRIVPSHIASAKTKRDAEKQGFKLTYCRQYSGYMVYKFEKENKDLKTSENLL